MMDDEFGRELLRPLLAEPTPPSGLDVGGVVRKGRSRVRARRLMGTVGAATVVLAAIPLAFSVVQGAPQVIPTETAQEFAQVPPPAPSPPESCVPVRLPVPDWAVSSQVRDGDPTGRYLVGWAATAEGFRRPLLWDRGTLIVLDTTSDLNHIVVNSAGVVAASGLTWQDGKLRNVAWVYRDGAFTQLPQPGADNEFIDVAGINERGDILGSDNTLDWNEDTGEYHPQQLPLVWPAAAPGTFRRPAAPSGPGMVRANGIDDDGTVVGARIGIPPRRGEVQETFSYALVWSPDGTVREVAGDSLTAVRDGWAISNRKEGVFRWNLRTGADKRLRLPFALSVNAHGWVGGQWRQGKTELPAVDFGTGKVLELPLPDGMTPDTEDSHVSTISDDGRVMGGVVSSGPDTRMAVQWSCS
ncbi:hypothetical protein [Allorhizocola rhizosphaerae]|uniref:hypothetical protein n=1 Tax=Allorhizocola rhizosphaerae TaxID=1872709 RepID=UPI001B8CC052|nr:hypothetical protein [Allorhizocola rhizosphaerae]